jgi:hypothetical protein
MVRLTKPRFFLKESGVFLLRIVRAGGFYTDPHKYYRQQDEWS